MFLRSSWLPARIPFTLLTLPLFWFVLSISPNLHPWRSLWVLFIVHGLLYGAVHAYLNFYDATVSKVNGFTVTRTPSEAKLNVAIAIHSLAILLGFVFVNLTFAALVFLYGLIAYARGLSNGSSRLTTFSWLFIRFIQGFVATLIYYIGLNDLPLENMLQAKVLVPGAVSTLVLAAFFPSQNNLRQFKDYKHILLQRLDLLIISAGLSVWYFATYISSDYSLGIISAFAIGALLLIQQHYRFLENTRHPLTKSSSWIHWLSSIILNGYAFYVFADYTQIFQLIH